MSSGKLDDTPVHRACLYLLAEWHKQEKDQKYKMWRLRKLFEVLEQTLLYERDRPKLIETPGPGFSVDPMVKQKLDDGK